MQQFISKLTQTALVLLIGAALLIHNDQAMAANGTGAYGGLSITPTAQIESGIMTFQVQNRVIGTGRYDGINLTNVFGLSDFLEVGGRIAAMLVHIYAQTGDDPRSAASQLVDCTKKVVSGLPQKLRSLLSSRFYSLYIKHVFPR